MIGKVLTFVPNSYCNFGCKYCYLGELTYQKEKTFDIAIQFRKIANKLKDDGVIITKVILHGAELTASPYEDVKELLEAISEYKKENLGWIKLLDKTKQGVGFISLKTNLYNLDKFYDLFVNHEVGVSASIDLPLRFHEKYRVFKNGKSTLDKCLKMVELLAKYPYFKQISATMTKEHLEVDEFINDIKKLESLGFDMANNFYVMFAYQSSNALGEFKMPSDVDMANFYNSLRDKLKGSKFEFACEHIWFKEFLGGYCTNCTNCGDNLLIQKNGDTYICHRSQALPNLKAGNIFDSSYNKLLDINLQNIQAMENSLNLHSDCLECEYFYLCQASCTIERENTKLGKAYTCALQKEIYKNNPNIYKADKELSKITLDEFLRQNQIDRYESYHLPNLSIELRETKNNLANIIAKDEILKQLYSRDNFAISVNDSVHLLSFEKDDMKKCFSINSKDSIKLLIKKEVFSYNAKYPVDNYIYMSLLGGKSEVYGDEAREKILHIENKNLYLNKIISEGLEYDGYYIYDISEFINANAKSYSDSPNFIFFTTRTLREYHYEKHKNNAFYHIQTMNLPFARFEFIWKEEVDHVE